MRQPFQILLCGDSAVAVQFGEKADIETSLKVRTMDRMIKSHPQNGVTETIPTYRSLMVHYDPLRVRFLELADYLRRLGEQVRWDGLAPSTEGICLPVCYSHPGTEIETVAKFEKMRVEDVIRIHSQSEHYVFMIGFAPANAYIGCPAGTFTISRKTAPAMAPYDRSVQIWSDQTTVAPFLGQTGWYSLGRTPVRTYDPRKENPSYFQSGEWVKFMPVTMQEYELIERDVLNMRYQPERFQRQTQD